jgi:hypothetical protein
MYQYILHKLQFLLLLSPIFNLNSSEYNFAYLSAESISDLISIKDHR